MAATVLCAALFFLTARPADLSAAAPGAASDAPPAASGGASDGTSPLDLSGQASSWLSVNDSPSLGLGFGLRYIPSLDLSLCLSPALTLDAEASVNASLSGTASRGAQATSGSSLRLYRAWVRLSSARFEARLGLQKINFGSAALLRPLMWFDRLDPRDPLQVTDGVTGLLVRYYFPGNATVWAWALHGNDDPKGWETNPTARRTAELGGRLQVPLFKGELGLTYHRRRADLGRGSAPRAILPDPVVPEDRWALDGKWDLAGGAAVWAEGALVRQRRDSLPFPYQRFLAAGADTTLPLGNGVHLLAEHLRLEAARGALQKGEGRDLTAASASTPLGLLDRVSAIVFYDWSGRKLYNFLSWQRTLDDWQLFVIGFLNPPTGGITPGAPGVDSFSGKGIMLMAVFNH